MPIRQVVILRNGPQVPASQTGLDVADIRCARTGRVRTAYVYCRAIAGTTTVDILKNNVSMLTAVVTPVADAQTAASLDFSKTAVAVGDRLSFEVTTAAASTLDDCNVTLDLG